MRACENGDPGQLGCEGDVRREITCTLGVGVKIISLIVLNIKVN